VPFAIGMTRLVVRIARRLAAEVIPVRAPVDLGRAPRRALAVALGLGLALAVGVPTAAAIQPFVPGTLAFVLAGAGALAIALYRSIRDFEGHVRAAGELVLELLAGAKPELPHAELEILLPGFADTVSLALPADAPAIGRTLGELDLRASTGATVLAIARAEHGIATPSPTEALRAGDVLALAGTQDAIAAARRLLVSSAPGGP
jgi:CPA2 family monovalent cation:H+ antiporter-2